MKLRLPREDELPLLKDLHKKLNDGFEFPDLTFMSSIYVVEHDKSIIGFGVLLPIFESVVVLDKEKEKGIRMEALQLLVNRAEYELSSQGITQYHAFVQDKSFFNMLKKRFGFKPTKGTALVRMLNG